MKQLKNNWKEYIIAWLEKRRVQEKLTERETAKEAILFNLSNDLTTKESIDLFEEVRYEYYQKMKLRLDAVTEEKTVLEKFLNI